VLSPGRETDREATAVLADYYCAFSTLDVQAVLPYFHEPALLVSPHAVFAAPTGAELATALAPVIESLRAREFGRSELNLRDVQVLSATTTLVRGVALRYKLDGRELERSGVTYILQKAETAWKIAVLILHDPE